MFPPTEYLRWANRFYGTVEFDLANSGTAPVPTRELGAPTPLEHTPAWEPLRARVAAYNAVPASEALPTFGTTHGLWTAYSSLLSPGEDALVEWPAYEPMVRIAEGVGARVVTFERAAASRFALDPACVARAMTPRTRVVAISNLHNPSGARASDDAIREIARIADAQGAHLLVDEVYAPFDALCDGRGVWTGSARRLASNVVAVSSLTKCYGLGAHRIGWMLAPANVIARGEDALLSNVGHAPHAWMTLAAHAFDRLPALADRARALLVGKRAKVGAWVAARPHLAWSAPTEGLFGLAIDSRGTDLRERIERGAKEHGVLVAPGSFFGVPNGFRLSWSIDGAKLDEALARLGRVLG